jgi:hypothetical protein
MHIHDLNAEDKELWHILKIESFSMSDVYLTNITFRELNLLPSSDDLLSLC